MTASLFLAPRLPAFPHRRLLTTAAAALMASALCGQHPALDAFMRNIAAVHGQSSAPLIHATVSAVLADVQEVSSTATDVYVQATGIPSYPVGPFPGNPNIPSNQSWQVRVPRTPQEQLGPQTSTPLGSIGLFVDGVVMFNAKDAHTYLDLGVWHQNAVVVEAASFDANLGHPSGSLAYHQHQQPIGLLAQLGDTSVDHSPLIGFAYDGYPVYGPRGFSSPDGSGGVRRMVSSFRLRAIAVRRHLPDGTPVPMAQWGPAVGPLFPLGYFVEDYEFSAGIGDLDANNGRFTVTPEYASGTYAYFATIDAAGASAYPYLVGPTYHGIVATDNFGGHAAIPATATPYQPFTLYVTNLRGGATAVIATGFGPPGGLVGYGLSLSGGGPLSTPFGLVTLSSPIYVMGPFVLDALGGNVSSLPIAASLVGTVSWWQAIAFDAAGSVVLSHGTRARVF